uniref:C2 domain-containing protein n=1 Tax=Monopterus albus TaxID=43700 RepID=A0A3Q3IGM6_MONAL|nr:uncharacterized protein LOC109962422 isoform X2 [Monopterus albus]
MSSLNIEEDQKWVPTHVQVTVLRGRGLRGKGKHGTSDVYTIIQLGKEKYSTCVAEKTTEPEWKEECSFELQPGVLDSGGRSGYPAGCNNLVLTVMHRALIGLDVFLGQAVIQLDKVFQESRCVKNEWYRLDSKTGKKEKERGDIQVTVQFTRNNLTASMYELVMKDQDASTFSKLKERIKGKRSSIDEDSSSAVLPGGYGPLYWMRQRLPSDGGGEEDYEDDEGGEVRRSKMRTFFLRGKLRKSSDTRSSTSLGSGSSESSSRGGSLSPTAGISVVVSDLSNSPSNSSNLTADNSPEHTANTSPKSPSLKYGFGDEAGEITIAVPQINVCVNGSHDNKPPDPGSGKPASSLGVGLLQKSLPLSMSLQNLSPRASTDLSKSPVGDGRRWSFDKPGEEEKAAIVAALELSGPMLGEEEERLPKAVSTAESENQGKKQRRNLFSHGRSESAGKGQSQSKDESEQAPAATEEKHRGWFGSKDSHIKPSLVVSPTLEPSTDLHPPPLPPSHHPPGVPVAPATVASPLHHSNPFSHSQTTPPPFAPCNPFFSLLQHNPFFEDVLITTQPIDSSLPPVPCLSGSQLPVADLFPQASNPNATLTHDNPTTEDSFMGIVAKSDMMAEVEKQLGEGEKTLSKKLSNPFMSSREMEADSEWDDSFEVFAAGRLQSHEDQTPDCKTQQNSPSDHPLKCCNGEGALVPIADADQNTNVNDTLHSQPFTEFVSEAHESVSQVSSTNKHHLDTFAQVLETIPEHRSFGSDSTTINASDDSTNQDACSETNQANSTANTNDLTDAKMHHVPCHTLSIPLNSSSPDPGSSGLGSSAEEDLLSWLSSYSDIFSASSSEETEAQNFESKILGFEKSSESAVVKNSKPSESEGDITDGLNDPSSGDVAQEAVIQQKDIDDKVDSNGSERSLAPQSPLLTPQNLMSTAKEIGTEGADPQTLNFSNLTYPDLLQKPSELDLKSTVLSQSDNESGHKDNSSIVDFSKMVSDSSVNTHVVIPPTPEEELCSKTPSLYIITSSPRVRCLGGQDVSQLFPVPSGPFDDLLKPNPGNDIDSTLLHTQGDQSTSSFLQSSFSTESQGYQTCESHLSSEYSIVSEPNETLHSANSLLCGDLNEIQTAGAALCLEDSAKHRPSSTPEDKMATLKPSFTIGDEMKVPPAAPTDSYICCNPNEISKGGVESQHFILDYEFSKSPLAQPAPLNRSHSEGMLTSSFDKLPLPLFGSDPGTIQESSTAQRSSDLPCLSSFAPSLTPEGSPVALSSLPFLAIASAWSPPSATQGAAPNPVPMPQVTQQQQAANQENSPHPVKPLTTAMLAEEKRTEGRSVLATGLEKLKSTIHPGRSSQLSEQNADRKKPLAEGAGSYYHLTHSELVALLVQREAELERQKAEFEQQKVLLAKREVELKKLKPQVRDLEDYIDTLLVRIMEQKPNLLQVRSKFK